MTSRGTPTPPLLEALLSALDEAADSVKRELAARLQPYLAAGAPHLLGAKARASQLGLNPESLVKMARAGRVPGARIVGREWRFPADCEVLPLVAPVTPAAPAPAPRRRPAGRSSLTAIRGR